MSETPKLGVPLLATNTAQKEVVINEALVTFDALIARSAKTRQNNPPAAPVAGDTYIVGTAPTGVWGGHANEVAFFFNGWRFITPTQKMKFFLESTGWFTYSGTQWSADPVSEVSTLDDLTNVGGAIPEDKDILMFDEASGQWHAQPLTLTLSVDDLEDVDLTNLEDGWVLVFSAAEGKFVPQALPTGGGGASALSELTDVDQGSAAAGRVLTWDTGLSKAVWATLPDARSLTDLLGVDFDSIQPGDVVAWNGASFGPSPAVITYSFLGMVDGPQTFDGFANHFLVVDPTESEMVFKSLDDLIDASTLAVTDFRDVPDPTDAAVGKFMQLQKVGGVFSFTLTTPTDTKVRLFNAGVELTPALTALNLVGFTIEGPTESSATVTVTAKNALTFQADGETVDGDDPIAINFTGDGVGVTNVDGVIQVTISRGGSLTALDDVDLSDAPSGGQVLMYHEADEVWRPGTIESGDILPPIAGQGGKALMVRGDETAVVWRDLPEGGSGEGAVLPVGGGDGHLMRQDENGAVKWFDPLDGFPRGGVSDPYGAHAYWRLVATRNAGDQRYACVAALDLRPAPGVPMVKAGGSAISSGHYGSQAAANAFDGNASTVWESQLANPLSAGAAWVGYHFAGPVSITAVGIRINPDYGVEARPLDGRIEYSDDGDVWVTAWDFDDLAYTEIASEQIIVSPDIVAPTERHYLVPDPSESGGKLLSAKEDGSGVEWIDAPEGGSGGIEEAPDDGKLYGRKDGAWVDVVIPQAGHTVPAVVNASTLHRQSGQSLTLPFTPKVGNVLLVFWRNGGLTAPAIASPWAADSGVGAWRVASGMAVRIVGTASPTQELFSTSPDYWAGAAFEIDAAYIPSEGVAAFTMQQQWDGAAWGPLSYTEDRVLLYCQTTTGAVSGAWPEIVSPAEAVAAPRVEGTYGNNHFAIAGYINNVRAGTEITFDTTNNADGMQFLVSLPTLERDVLFDGPRDGKLRARKDGEWAEVVIPKLVTLTQAAYDALAVKDTNTYYFILED